MVAITKLALLSTVALAAPAPEQDTSLLVRDLSASGFGSADVVKRFVDDAVALDARAAQDWIQLFNIFQSFTTAGVSLFLSSIDALKNVSPEQANAAITSSILQAKLALNQLTTWLKNYNGLAGWTKVFVNLYISSGLSAFITNLGLFIIQLSTTISKNKAINTYASQIQELIAAIKAASALLASTIPGFNADASALSGFNSKLQGLLTDSV